MKLTNWKRRQLIFLHVELGQMVCPGKYSVWNSVALVVLHVQGLRVDELGRTTGWEGSELK